MLIITGTLLKTLGTSFNALYSGGLGQVSGQREAVATTVPSTTKTNEYGWLGELDDMREWIGDRQVKQLKGHGYSIDNKDWELTVEVKRTDIEDDNVGAYSLRFTAMGRSTAAHPEKLVWGALAQGHTLPCYDGQNFFDTDHPVLDATGTVQSVSNSQAGAGAAWYLIDDTQTVKPIIYQERKAPQFVARDNPEDPTVFNRNVFTYGVDYRGNVGFGFWQFAYRSQADLTDANYEAARAAMAGFTGDHGRKIGVKPSLLIVPRSLEGKALKILNAETNALGESNVWKGTARLLVCDWL